MKLNPSHLGLHLRIGSNIYEPTFGTPILYVPFSVHEMLREQKKKKVAAILPKLLLICFISLGYLARCFLCFVSMRLFGILVYYLIDVLSLMSY